MSSVAVAEDGSEHRQPSLAAAWLAPTPRNLACWGGFVFLVSLAAFLWGIQAAPDVYFDETWYVPTARAWLQTGQMLHQEHPPLAKLLIAFGLRLFGDNPLGWRAMSALFGAIAMVAMLLWSFALLGDLSRALWTSAVTFFDAIVFVQARIAMLDIFLMAFCLIALAFFTSSVKETSLRRSRAYGLAMGASLGLAGACKLSGFFLWFGLLAIQGLAGLLRLWRVRFDDPRANDFYSPEGSRAWTPIQTLLAFGVAPFLAYFLSYAPQMIHEGTLLEFVASHRRMAEILSGHSPDHPYMSLWYTWPALWRPVWYLFLVKGGGDASLWTAANPAAAVVGLANPLVVYPGEVAVLVAIYRFVARRERDPLIVAVAFLAQYLPWMANPKGLEFSYYYFPSVLCLGPALALVFFSERGKWRTAAALGFLAAAGLSFAYFLPLLAAGVGVGPAAFTDRMWLPSWR